MVPLVFLPDWALLLRDGLASLDSPTGPPLPANAATAALRESCPLVSASNQRGAAVSVAGGEMGPCGDAVHLIVARQGTLSAS
jgi:hypothetical protein